ncbi:MAG: helix-turn-helix domain-containing protein [Rhodospirillales bacterium]|nr:helix-turn-helix domain-containing protein [Rhodospirillales bacterium]
MLANADGKAITRGDLVDAISTGDGPISIRAVDILISRLRKKLDKKAILTISKVGYRCGWETVEEC